MDNTRATRPNVATNIMNCAITKELPTGTTDLVVETLDQMADGVRLDWSLLSSWQCSIMLLASQTVRLFVITTFLMQVCLEKDTFRDTTTSLKYGSKKVSDCWPFFSQCRCDRALWSAAVKGKPKVHMAMAAQESAESARSLEHSQECWLSSVV